MNRKYEVIITERADQDIDEIDDYIGVKLGNPVAARRLIGKIHKGLRQLEDFPKSGKAVWFEPLYGDGYRQLNIENYVVLYVTEDSAGHVIVMRVVWGARDLGALAGE